MILVAGGTGTLGSRLVGRLVEHGQPVRVLSRKGSDGARFGSNVEVVTGDVRDPVSLVDAVAGARAVVSAVTGFGPDPTLDPRSIDAQGNANLIHAAREGGVEHFVLISIHGASPDAGMELGRMKAVAEAELRSSGGLAWTIVRPTVYMETWGTILGVPLLETGKAMVFGRATTPVNFISVGDVAGFVELALADPGLRGQAIDLGGPENLSMRQVVQRFADAAGIGRPRVRRVPLPMLRFMAAVMPHVKPMLARQAEAAISMDAGDMTFDASGSRSRFPDVPSTPLSVVIDELVSAREGRTGTA